MQLSSYTGFQKYLYSGGFFISICEIRFHCYFGVMAVLANWVQTG